jgi:hypothetical protein
MLQPGNQNQTSTGVDPATWSANETDNPSAWRSTVASGKLLAGSVGGGAVVGEPEVVEPEAVVDVDAESFVEAMVEAAVVVVDAVVDVSAAIVDAVVVVVVTAAVVEVVLKLEDVDASKASSAVDVRVTRRPGRADAVGDVVDVSSTV